MTTTPAADGPATSPHSSSLPPALSREAALATLSLASPAAEAIEDDAGRAAALASVCALLGRAGGVSALSRTLPVALAAARGVSGDAARAGALAGVARSHAETGDTEAMRATVSTSTTHRYTRRLSATGQSGTGHDLPPQTPVQRCTCHSHRLAQCGHPRSKGESPVARRHDLLAPAVMDQPRRGAG